MKSQLNVLSSCEETDAMEDLSPLRSGGRKKKVLSPPSPAARMCIACKTLHAYVL